jgi:hypothetical protein
VPGRQKTVYKITRPGCFLSLCAGLTFAQGVHPLAGGAVGRLLALAMAAVNAAMLAGF